MPPAVSVVMSVHNGEAWVGAAIQSIQKQTMGNFEFIVMDDGSTDATREIVAAATHDYRVRVYRTERVGLSRQLCVATDLGAAPLIARLDADDMADCHRLEEQVRFLKHYPEVGLIGTGAFEEWATVGAPWVEKVTMPLDDAEIRRSLIRSNPFIHSSVMFRRSVYDQVGGYDPAVKVAQDYDLWMRMARVTKLANLPEPLVIRRRHPNQISVTRARERRLTEASVRWRAVRQGQYPWWCAAYAVKPLIGLAMSRVTR